MNAAQREQGVPIEGSLWVADTFDVSDAVVIEEGPRSRRCSKMDENRAHATGLQLSL
jgi:hypothetical protein